MNDKKMRFKIFIWCSAAVIISSICILLFFELIFRPFYEPVMCLDSVMKPCFFKLLEYSDEHGHFPHMNGKVSRILNFSDEYISSHKHVDDVYYLTAGCRDEDGYLPEYIFLLEPVESHNMFLLNSVFRRPQRYCWSRIRGGWMGNVITVPVGVGKLTPAVDAMNAEFKFSPEIYEELLLKAKKVELEPDKIFNN